MIRYIACNPQQQSNLAEMSRYASVPDLDICFTMRFICVVPAG